MKTADRVTSTTLREKKNKVINANNASVKTINSRCYNTSNSNTNSNNGTKIGCVGHMELPLLLPNIDAPQKHKCNIECKEII